MPYDDLTSKDCKKCSIEGCKKCKGTLFSEECTDCGNLINVYQGAKIIKCNKTCGESYYIPYDNLASKDCKKCSLEGCSKCQGFYHNNECTDCGNLINVYQGTKIIKCNDTCGEGYYIPYDDLASKDCKKCSVDGCSKCQGFYQNNECIDCDNLYKIYKGTKIIKCNDTCGDGYYIPDDDLTSKDCKKCTLEGCSKCQGSYQNNECIDCGNLINVYDDEKIIKCNDTCGEGYYIPNDDTSSKYCKKCSIKGWKNVRELYFLKNVLIVVI
jgi:hypothetical protein